MAESTEAKIARIAEMGFTRLNVEQALKRSNNDEETAVNYLLNQPRDVNPADPEMERARKP